MKKAIVVIIITGLFGSSSAFAADWIANGEVTNPGDEYVFTAPDKRFERFTITGSLIPDVQPDGDFDLSGELYLPKLGENSRDILAFLIGKNPSVGEFGAAGAEMVFVQSGQPPLRINSAFGGSDSIRAEYGISKSPDWLLLGGAYAICTAGAAVMTYWARVWGPAPAGWGGGDQNYVLGYGGAAFFVATAIGVTIWQMTQPTGKVTATGYAFPETGINVPVERWTNFRLLTDSGKIRMYVDGNLTLDEPGDGSGGISLYAIDGADVKLRNLDLK